MASSSRSLSRGLRCICRTTPAKRKCFTPLIQQQRHLSSTNTPKAKEPPTTVPFINDIDTLMRAARIRPEQIQNAQPPDELLVPDEQLTPGDLDPQERATYDTFTPEQQQSHLALLNHFKTLSEQLTPLNELDLLVPQPGQELNEELELSQNTQDRIELHVNRQIPLEDRIPRATSAKTGMGWWAEDDDDELGLMPDGDNDWHENIISSVAEGELQLHREIRQYTRVAAWEMPLLAKYAKPLPMPTHATPLRFRYTTHMGETHPSASKVVLEFTTLDIQPATQLTEAQRLKLQKLLGPRYNPLNDTARLSCEKFPNAAQNKRYLGDLLQTLVKEAKNAEDMFEDIPLDTRHVKPKKVHKFPEGWLLTEGRVRELAEQREKEGKGRDRERTESEVQGQARVEAYMRNMQRLSNQRRGAVPAGQGEKVPEREAVRETVNVR